MAVNGSVKIKVKRRLVGVAEFSRLVCSGAGHVNGQTAAKCRACGSKMGRSKSTVGFMAKAGRIPGAVKPGNEWLIDLPIALERQDEIVWRGRGRPIGSLKKGAPAK